METKEGETRTTKGSRQFESAASGKTIELRSLQAI